MNLILGFGSTGASVARYLVRKNEPFLIMEGYLMRTPRGRKATDLAFNHLGKTKSAGQGNFF